MFLFLQNNFFCQHLTVNKLPILFLQFNTFTRKVTVVNLEMPNAFSNMLP